MWKHIHTLCLALVLLTLTLPARSAEVISGDTKSYPLGQHLGYIIDRSGALTIEVLRQFDAQQQWLAITQEIPNLGYGTHVYWWKLELTTEQPIYTHWLLDIAYPLLDRIELYIYQEDTPIHTVTVGDKFPFSQRPIAHRNFVTPLTLLPQQRYTIYVRLHTSSSIQLPITLWESNHFWEQDATKSTYKTLFFGGMLLIAIYNLALFFFLRERVYLYYVAFVVGMLGLQSGINGMAYQYIFPAYPLAQDKIIPFSMGLLVFFGTLCTKHFLKLSPTQGHRYHPLDYVATICVAIFVPALLFPYNLMIKPLIFVALALSFAWLYLGIAQLNQGNQAARLFVLSWVALLLGGIILGFNKVGILPINALTESGWEIGSLIQATLLSMALASRINEERDAKALANRDALEANQRAVDNLLKYQSLFENAVDGIFKCSSNFALTHANPALAKMLGYTNADALIEETTDIRESLFFDKETANRLFEQLAIAKKAVEFEVRLKSKHNTPVWGSVSINALPTSSKRDVYEGSIREISERKEKEKAEEAQQQAFAATQAKTDFLANMSHEIRTPLTAIIGFAESIRDDQLDEDSQKHFIDTIIRSGQHLLHVINEILDLSKIEANKLDVEHIPVDLFKVMFEVQSFFEMKVRAKGMAFFVHYHFPLPRTFNSDITRLKQILLNLCSNALKFTEEGGINIDIACDPDTETLSFTVIDSGIGMSQAQQDKIFSAFTQADSSTTRLHGGTGLGLSIAKKLANLMGGDITVQSMEDIGSRFTVSIATGPLDDAEWIQDDHSARLTQEQSLGEAIIPTLTGRVLYAEDNPDNQRLIGMLVTQTGAELTLAANGVEAMVKALDKPFDLILMDIQMPIMSGTTATRLLRAGGYKHPIIAITANLMDHEVKSYLSAGCDDYLSKPVQRHRFFDALKHYLTVIAETQITAQHDHSLHTLSVHGTILLVDDNPDNIRLFSMQLTSTGASVTTATNGEEACELALAQGYDLMLMDINMPYMDGLEAMQLLRSAGYSQPIYALTAEDNKVAIDNFIAQGFTGYLPKPMDRAMLVHALEKHLPAHHPEPFSSPTNTLSASHYAPIIEQFIQGLAHTLRELESAKSSEDWHYLEDLSHQLKGSGGSFGYPSISDAARQLESLLKKGDYRAIEPAYIALYTDINHLLTTHPNHTEQP